MKIIYWTPGRMIIDLLSILVAFLDEIKTFTANIPNSHNHLFIEIKISFIKNN